MTPGHVAGHHRAVHRRNDIRVFEIELGAVDQRLVQLHRCVVLVNNIELVLGLLACDRVLLRELLITREVDPILVEYGLVAQELARILVERRLVGAGIDLRADLAGPHPRVVVAKELLDDAGDIAPDDDRQDRVYCARCSNHLRDGPA